MKPFIIIKILRYSAWKLTFYSKIHKIFQKSTTLRPDISITKQLKSRLNKISERTLFYLNKFILFFLTCYLSKKISKKSGFCRGLFQVKEYGIIWNKTQNNSDLTEFFSLPQMWNFNIIFFKKRKIVSRNSFI